MKYCCLVRGRLNRITLMAAFLLAVVPHVAGALVRGGLADRVLLLVSPVAGGDGPPALEGVPKASDLRDLRVRKLGDDLALEGVLG